MTRPRIFIFSCFYWLFLGTSILWAQPQLSLNMDDTPTVRVLLEENSEAAIRLPAAHRGYVDDILRFSAASALHWLATARDNQLLIDDVAVGRSLTLEPMGNSFLEWEGEQYRGVVRLQAVGNQVQIINIVPIENYLRGVVPSEMHASWPLEALKAQAVAARTYTLVNVDPQATYDICATDACQEYHGVGAEHPSSDVAIRDTQALVLSYGGELVRSYYHADSGGQSAGIAEVWGMRDVPYLTSQPDYIQDSPHSNWTVDLNPSQVGAVLRRYGHDVGVVQDMQVLATGASGRVAQIGFVGDNGSVVLQNPILTDVLRDLGLKSTLLRTNGLQVTGQGWGHGVGMSQYGARTLANYAYDYEQILEFYYPQSSLQALNY